MTQPGLTMHSVGDSVYALHPAASWVMGKVLVAAPNPAFKPGVAPKVGHIISQFLYEVRTCDTDRKMEGETLKELGSHAVEVCDESMMSKITGVDDLLSLTHLHEATLLRCLYMRYMTDVVYTNIGSIVVALNPFSFNIAHYKDDQMTKYLAEGGNYILTSAGEAGGGKSLLPHSWSQAHNTYMDLKTSRLNQCILISGESGSGKTEATKIVVKYLSKVSALSLGPATTGAAANPRAVAAEDVLKNLMACSPVLEAFGNARTVRNDNSSRFGKLMQLKFDNIDLVVLGAFTTKYLLEKSRIVFASPGERVYHSFYLAAKSSLVAATAPSTLPKSFDGPLAFATTDFCRLKTHPIEKNVSIYSGKQLQNSEFDNVDAFEEVCQSMVQLGLTEPVEGGAGGPDTIRDIWRIVAGVIHQCNLQFVPDNAAGEGDISFLAAGVPLAGAGVQMSAGGGGTGEGSVVQTSNPVVKSALSSIELLWGIAAPALLREYTTMTLVVAGTATTKFLPPFKAVDVRDALSKAIYDALFAMLVERCNAKCDVPENESGNGGGGQTPWIALLDIFGFEDFELNSFEQLCINLANETLQGHYNDFIFTKDMALCAAEGIDIKEMMLTPPDNSGCLELIAGPGLATGGPPVTSTKGNCILTVLDDQCSLGKGTDLAFYDTVLRDFDGPMAGTAGLAGAAPTGKGTGGHPYFYKKKLAKALTFVIKHYAGDVQYDVNGWLEKNRDTLKESLKELCRQNPINAVLASLFAASANAKSVTVGTYFRQQLKSLMAVIQSTNPHWIRCVKPHPAKKPRMFDGVTTMNQLESSGVLSTVKIRKAGYPVRFPLLKFIMRYLPISFPSFVMTLSAAATAQESEFSKLAETMISPADMIAQCNEVLKVAQMGDQKFSQVGKTLVFLKSDAYTLIEKKRTGYVKLRGMTLQRLGRGYRARRRLFILGKAQLLQRVGRQLIACGSLFAAYCQANKQRLLEERRKREEQRRKEEEARLLEEQKLLKWRLQCQAETSELLLREEEARRAMCEEHETNMMEECRRRYDNIVLAFEEERDKEAAIERRRVEEERKQREEWKRQRMLALSEPLLREAEGDTDDLQVEEGTLRMMIMRTMFVTGIRIMTMEKCWDVEQQEAVERQRIASELVQEWYPMWTDQLTVIQRVCSVEASNRLLYRTLDYNRRLRAAKERERREKAERVERSEIEKLLVREEAAVSPTKYDGTDHSAGRLSITAGATVSPPVVKGRSVGHGSPGGGGVPSVTFRDTPDRTPSEQPLTVYGPSPPRYVTDPAELIRRLDTLEKKELREQLRMSDHPAAPYHSRPEVRQVLSVELGQRVYCSRRKKAGTVIDFPCPASASLVWPTDADRFDPDAIPNRLQRCFLVQYDAGNALLSSSGGDTEWLELDDVVVRIGIDDINPLRPMVPHPSERVASQLSSSPGAALDTRDIDEHYGQRQPVSHRSVIQPRRIEDRSALVSLEQPRGRLSQDVSIRPWTSPTAQHHEIQKTATVLSPPRAAPAAAKPNHFAAWKDQLDAEGW